MLKLNSAVLTVMMMFLTIPGGANAASWICEQSNLIREINVERQTANPAPCSVVYNKDTEGKGSSVLWTAQVDGAYCDEKADGLAQKLEGFGWTCNEF